MSRTRILSGLTLAACVAAPSLAQTPLGTGFTYQGDLKVAGLPANGTYDLQFKLYTAASGGSLIATDCMDGVMPQDGLFTVEVDFGAAAFNGDARWVEIGVRSDTTGGNCAGGAYTTLTTRQPLTAVPYALYALSGPGSGGFWAASGSAISNTNSGFVGVKRSTQVSAAEYFGIQAPVTSGYGGMYIRTDGAAGLPFYGYKSGTTGETAWTYLDGASGDWRVNVDGDRLTVTDTGNVGIGTTTPGNPLTVLGSSTAGEMTYVRNSGPGRAATFESIAGGTISAVLCYKENGPALHVFGTMSTPGTAATDAPMAIVGGSDSSLTGGGFLVLGGTNSANVAIDNNEIMARSNGAAATLFLNHEGGDVQIGQGSGGTGKIVTPVIQITGGSDLSENFDISTPAGATGADARVEPGMVVCIDPRNPGKLIPCSGAYDRTVAGVISGAGGVKTGMLMGQQGSIADGAHPVALTGRVYALCDASDQAVEPGDLLTTSARPGHAMPVADPARAQGAIIGKAMSGLRKGERGLVLVLVNLQ